MSDNSTPKCPAQPKNIGPVTKAPLDSKNYKAIELQNGLKAVLVSTCIHELDSGGSSACSKSSKDAIKEFNKKHLGIDSYEMANEESTIKSVFSSLKSYFSPTPSCNEGEQPAGTPKIIKCCKGPATACVVVGAGSFHDPPAFPGLAHLVEHAVFLGSKRFPEKNRLFVEVYQHDGVANAFTQAEHTCYYFSSNTNGFEGCLEMLADAVKDPLLEDNAIRREVEAIDSEYSIKQNCDLTRLYDFLRSLAKKGHPMRKFYWGNKESLSHPRLVEQVREWKDRYYRADYMTLCVQAPMSVECLEEMVNRLFSEIPRSSPDWKTPIEELELCDEPFEASEFRALYHLAPVANMNQLLITWSLPPKYWMDYDTKPLEYVRSMLNTRSEGGLYRYLRNNHWITRYFSSCSRSDNFYRNTFCSMYCIQIYLTEEGMKHRGELIFAIFSYIKLLQTNGLSKRYFDEMQRTASNCFHYNNWEEMMESCQEIGSALHCVPPTHVLTSQRLLTKYCSNLIQECLDLLSPRSANFIFVSNTNAKECRSAAWGCGICNKKHPIPEAWYSTLESVQVYDYFKLPPHNSFLAKEISEGCTEIQTSPSRLFADAKLSVKYVCERRNRCVTSRVPTATYRVFLHSSAIDQMRARQGVWAVLNQILWKSIDMELGFEFKKLFQYDLEVYDDSICVFASGPSCHLVELLGRMIRVIFEFKPEGEFITTEFDDVKTDKLREYENEVLDIQTLSEDMLAFLLSCNHLSYFHIHDGLNMVDFPDFANMINTFKRRMTIEADLYGSVSQDHIKEILKLLKGHDYRPSEIMWLPDRQTVIPLKTSVLRVQALHPAYVISIVSNHYHFGPYNPTMQNFMALVFRAIRRRLPNQLRTIEQLGYTVRATPVTENDSLGLTIVVFTQPQKFSTKYVDERVENFLKCFYKECLKNEVVAQKMFAKITNGAVNFHEIKRLYSEYLLEDGKNFRKLSLQVVGFRPNLKPCEQPCESSVVGSDKKRIFQLEYLAPAKKSPGVNVISDIYEFKRALPLLPAACE